MFKIMKKAKYEQLTEENGTLTRIVREKAEHTEALKGLSSKQLLELEKLQGENTVLHKEVERISLLLKEIKTVNKKQEQELITLNHLAKCNKQTIHRLTAENERMQQLSPTIQSVLDNLEKYKQIAINNRMYLDFNLNGNQLGRFAYYKQKELYNEWFQKQVSEHE